MEIVINKEDFANSIKIVEKVTAQKSNQPILSNILIETVASDRVRFCATDINLAIDYKTNAEVIKEGSTTLNAKKLLEIASRASSSEIKINTEENVENAIIKSGKTEFDLISLNPEEFPKAINKNENEEYKTIVLNKNDFSKAIKQVIFAVSTQETQTVLTGVCFTIENNTLELAATDGNRLTRIQKQIDSTGLEGTVNFIVPFKTLQEVQRISSIVEDENVTLEVAKNKIIFKFNDLIFYSHLIEGTYPKYQQLIPTNNDKKIVIDRAELINAIERVCVIFSEKTQLAKFNFTQGQLEISANTPEAGKSKDYIDIDYNQDDLLIAFNYKYVLDALKSMDSTSIVIEISDVLAASIFKPHNDTDNYICLIMPIKVQ